MQTKKIDISKVSQFSDKDAAYYREDPELRPFYEYEFKYESFGNLIDRRKEYACDRATLVDVLKAQYDGIPTSKLTSRHIEGLLDDSCFTITTAHQPSLMTGPLYYIYKILSVVNITRRLSGQFPHMRFVPVFVIGGEDHDFEEINHFHLFNKRLEWEREAAGPVGRLSTKGLESVIEDMRKILGDGSLAHELTDNIHRFSEACPDYGTFAFRLTHLLFDHLGLVILRMDHPELKAGFTEQMKKEILGQVSKPVVNKTQAALRKAGFEPQAYARDINFFYIGEGLRNRIEKVDDTYEIVGTDISFTRAEIEREIENHPANFSPNVVMRPLYQEHTLPNLAYVGGGGEIAYWLERKAQFEHFGIHFPMLIRRVSATLIGKRVLDKQEKLGIDLEKLFMPKPDLIKHYLDISDAPDYRLDTYKTKLAALFDEISGQAAVIDKTLAKTVASEGAKARKSLDYLESKLKKSVKQQQEVQLNRLEKAVDKLFPGGGLQERHDNIFEYLSLYGPGLIDEMLPWCDPFGKSMVAFILDHP